MVCNPYLTVLMFFEEYSGALRVLWWLPLISKMSCIISGDNILCISVANVWRFLWWTVTDLSLGRSSSNNEKWLLCTILSALSWSLFILRFICLLWNIQISGQYANCKETNAFMIILSFLPRHILRYSCQGVQFLVNLLNNI